ncbi:hypothetical protein BKP45_05065 [Anaerobacillus alkalidiazotrophicus]|uniref:Uncharacterized protein n=1 Tax=Anaerobacillus alkalidiazotrophicus TaxID=472963 RepID=A0A1S2MBJ5_9BACI|nr:hypothetical protein [Anaerobacillus alkalidiazotrophicus]OIJ22049.1 hypothetical protein BKP45_05065 [Anaerobacillus alkalidiazotrophicus]
MPEFQTFLSGSNMTEFWNNVKWFLFFIAPIIMIFFAIDVIGHLIVMIRKALGVGEKNDDDDDYDVYRY